MVRSIQPIDALVLCLFRNTELYNAAVSSDVLKSRGVCPGPWVFLQQWSRLGSRRHTWIQEHSMRVQGVVSAVERPDSAWEIDYLILSKGDKVLCAEFLDCVGHAAADARATRVFLRLVEEEVLVDAARNAGFSPYVREQLYCYRGAEEDRVAFPRSYYLSPLAEADKYAAFRLYSTTVPLAVRQVEGITFTEWEDARRRWAGSRECQELLLGDRERPLGLAALKPVGKAWLVQVIAIPSVEREVASVLLSLLSQLHCDSLFCLVPEFQGSLQRSLQDHNFQLVGEYVSLAKLNTLKARLPSFVPAQA